MINVSKYNKNTILYKVVRKVYRFFRNTFYPYGYIRNYILFPIAGFLRVHHIGGFYKRYVDVDTLRDKHSGKRCFIIATGPSLRVEDVEQLENEITIGVNTLYRMYTKTSFRPTYYMALDPDMEKHIKDDAEVPIENFAKDKVFLNSMMKEKYPQATYITICYQDHWFNLFNPKYNYSKNLKYSKDLLWGIYDKYTVTNAAIEMAIYMGCKEIYLMGVDCNYNGKKKHFSEPKDVNTLSEDQARMIQKSLMSGFSFMEKETKKRGIHIYNATRGGMLEEFDRVNFDNLMKEKVSCEI